MEGAIAKLKNKGYRITLARKALLRTLYEAATPLTIPELAARTDSNEVSVYRNIELFTIENLVEIIHTTDSLPRYALSHGHHHHIVCTDCKRIVHVPCGPEVTIPTHNDFLLITDHEVTYYGLCNKCCPS
tara:strand:+ start:1964 stop:2353 length:390 start_codon:yes stop_codon:yes gene_type:complete